MDCMVDVGGRSNHEGMRTAWSDVGASPVSKACGLDALKLGAGPMSRAFELDGSMLMACKLDGLMLRACELDGTMSQAGPMLTACGLDCPMLGQA